MQKKLFSVVPERRPCTKGFGLQWNTPSGVNQGSEFNQGSELSGKWYLHLSGSRLTRTPDFAPEVVEDCHYTMGFEDFIFQLHHLSMANRGFGSSKESTESTESGEVTVYAWLWADRCSWHSHQPVTPPGIRSSKVAPCVLVMAAMAAMAAMAVVERTTVTTVQPNLLIAFQLAWNFTHCTAIPCIVKMFIRPCRMTIFLAKCRVSLWPPKW